MTKLLIERQIQVSPFGIHLFDQFKLPCAPPALDAFFVGDGIFYLSVVAIPDQLMDLVFFGEAGDATLAVFEYPSRQIIGDAHIERAIALAGQHIDMIAALHASIVAGRIQIVIGVAALDFCAASLGPGSRRLARDDSGRGPSNSVIPAEPKGHAGTRLLSRKFGSRVSQARPG